MFSKLYKALYYQRWFRQLCLVGFWHTMRQNPAVWHEKQKALDRIYGSKTEKNRADYEERKAYIQRLKGEA